MRGLTVWCLVLYLCRMWDRCTTDCLHFQDVQPVPGADAEVWVSQHFGHGSIQQPQALVAILCSFVDTEAVVWNGAHELLTDEDPVIVRLCQDWITARELDRGTYAADLLTNGTLVDGLFLALAIAWVDKHVAVIHSEGMWSSCVDSSLRACGPHVWTALNRMQTCFLLWPQLDSVRFYVIQRNHTPCSVICWPVV